MPPLTGLAELGEIDEAFRPFAYTLFREDRLGLDTDQQTDAANETIRQSIERLLTMLSPYFMRDAATKVLEFLIRQYRSPLPPTRHLPKPAVMPLCSNVAASVMQGIRNTALPAG